MVTWTNPPIGERISPPDDTVAVVVDLTNGQGALRIFEKETGGFVDGVGTEEKGNQILIPWRLKWRLRISGQLRIGYVS
jgi:hypothetical protein